MNRKKRFEVLRTIGELYECLDVGDVEASFNIPHDTTQMVDECSEHNKIFLCDKPHLMEQHFTDQIRTQFLIFLSLNPSILE